MRTFCRFATSPGTGCPPNFDSCQALLQLNHCGTSAALAEWIMQKGFVMHVQALPGAVACQACRTARLTLHLGRPCAAGLPPSQSAPSPAREPPTRYRCHETVHAAACQKPWVSRCATFCQIRSPTGCHIHAPSAPHAAQWRLVFCWGETRPSQL